MLTKDRPREKALSTLRAVEDGAFTDALLDEARATFDSRDSAFILELVNGVLRNRTLLDRALDQFSSYPIATTDAWTRNILRMAAYQMLFLDRVPVSAAVNTATDLAKIRGKKHGYVNGLLRNLDRKRGEVKPPASADPIERLSTVYSHPAWLVKRWFSQYGAEATEAICASNNRPAPLVIRTNIMRTTRAELRTSLESEGAMVSETGFSPAGLVVMSSPGLRQLTAYKKGWFTVQDEAAQLVGLLLAPRPGEAVLDACAAPGGKATHLAELMRNEGTVVALDPDSRRLERVIENTKRLGASIIRPVKGDATLWHEGTYDKVLIDAPCSGLGVLRRHPDGRWTKNEKDILARRQVQDRILANCAPLLKPGGAMVYATCTTAQEENEDAVDAFLAGSGNGYRIDDPRPYLPEQAHSLVDTKGFFRTYPAALDMDGFFGVRMVRNT